MHSLHPLMINLLIIMHVLVYVPSSLGSQRETCPNSKLYWSVFFRIRAEYGAE